ncbi:transcriptional regulator GcvA [Jannaschia sp. W003]|uniref:transcriptional regulator GcvA n=1 Tax=Jannaschia sp. W003 TaxID=2867012 RepID=UPI0021A302A0|nr:transcriptional regulator GcvA [Jannaschia sp. W003]UWQ22869.1 transcriptional regulator GcvA [Jannaschia sp. W003]
MSDRLPPLTALRAFDAAARHLSFQDAAAELSVTPAALSFQIKTLETHLGAPLFRRLHRQVELTEAGRALAPHAREGFAALRTGWRAAARSLGSGELTVTAGPAFTARWLAPRMFAFAQDHPEVELRFAATLRLLDAARDEVDVAIRFGRRPEGGDPGLREVLAVREWMMPMMPPALAARFPDAASLRDAPLIHQDERTLPAPLPDWPAWFRAAGLAPPEAQGPRFSQADHALDAAEAGAGVVLGRAVLADGALRAGRLVAPFGPVLAPPETFRVLCAPGAEGRPAVRAFLGWLEEAVADTGCWCEGRAVVA